MPIKSLIIGAALFASPSPGVAQPHMWTLLSAADRIAPDGMDVIALTDPSRVRAVELSGVLGWSTIDRVEIQFADGTTRVVYPHAMLLRGSLYTIELAGARDVVGAIVYGNSSPNAAFELLGA